VPREALVLSVMKNAATILVRARSTFGADEITGASPADASCSGCTGCREFVQSVSEAAELPLAGKRGCIGPCGYLIIE
jgi:hypothetical protein